MRQPRFRLAGRLLTILGIASLIAGCREEAKPAAASPAGNATTGFEPPNADEITAAVTKAVESAKSGGSSSFVSGADGTVAVSFAMPGAEGVNIAVSTLSKAGKATATITVTLNNAEPLLLSAAAFAAIKTGMDYAQVSQTIGGEMTKGRLGAGYTGEFVAVQAGRRIELVFTDGKVASKKSMGIE
jgi:hypothetical protein